MITIVPAQRQLLTNATDRKRGNRVWVVPVDDVLLNTKLENEIVPLPAMDLGLNLIQQPATIGADIINDIRILIGDDGDPYYWSNIDLTRFYNLEDGDIEQAAATACESWASRLSYNEGNYSSGGITVNSSAIAADKRQRAAELRMRFTATGAPRRRV